MCGIAGIADWGGRRIEAREIDCLTDLLARRGPDGRGTWINSEGCIALGHRRLAILDTTEAGHQPMISSDGRFVITYNGSIYNFIELRAELEGLGHRFRSHSDTEVILAAWSEWGEGMLPRFNGAWAFAIYDQTSKELFLSRDRFGIKPLLYTLSARRFVFASEMGALRRAGAISGQIDLDIARRFVIYPFGIEASDRGIYSQVRRLPGGHSARLSNGKLNVTRWWRTVDHLVEYPQALPDQAERFKELFLDSVRLRMRADVSLGTCLSGGFDSTAVTCAMTAVSREPGSKERHPAHRRRAFVASFPGHDNDETPHAIEAAAYAHVHAHIFVINEQHALEEIDRVLEDLDDPYSSLPTAPWLIYRELNRNGIHVSLDGHGLDELLGAYFISPQTLRFRLRNRAAGLMAKSPYARLINDARTLAISLSGFNFLKNNWQRVSQHHELVGERDELPPQWDGLNRALYRMLHATILPTILRNFDRLSMAHGVEVRMPFMDWRLVCYAMSLPVESKFFGGMSKVVARDAMRGLMPEPIRVSSRKEGFGSPMPSWLNGPLIPWTQALLSQRVPEFAEIVGEERLARVVHSLNDRRAWSWQSAYRIWPYLNLKWLMARG
jgi:asparagine synthase (glutamine-hydrolysing)